QGIINRRVAMGMIFTHHLTDNTRRLTVWSVIGEVHLVHGVENSPVYGLETITHIRQSAAHNNAHSVIEIGALHLLNNRYRLDTTRAAGATVDIFGTGRRCLI